MRANWIEATPSSSGSHRAGPSREKAELQGSCQKWEEGSAVAAHGYQQFWCTFPTRCASFSCLLPSLFMAVLAAVLPVPPFVSGKTRGNFLVTSWLVYFFNCPVCGAHVSCLLKTGNTTAVKHFRTAWVKGKMEQWQVIPCPALQHMLSWSPDSSNECPGKKQKSL